jgi:MFS family permease
VIGVSTALGPTLGGVIIAIAGSADGWRWVFLVNLFIGAVTTPLAAWLLPRGTVVVHGGDDGDAGTEVAEHLPEPRGRRLGAGVGVSAQGRQRCDPTG